MGIGFAIPINMAKSIKEQLLFSGKVVRGWLGVAIQDITEELAESFHLDSTGGVLVSEVADESPAAQAGLQQGDVLLSMNGTSLHDVAELRNRIAMTAPDTSVKFSVIRDGDVKDISVTIGEQPSSMNALAPSSTTEEEPYTAFGLSLQDLTPEIAREFGYKENQGVLIAGVDPGSPAEGVNLQSGQLIEEVNRKRVHNMAELRKVMASAQNKKQLLFRVRAGEYSHYVVLRAE